uniref:S-adenosyl-L-methionine-dependent methyltransferases superfamily protein n=1 Tax=Tanacetum cinerariifolium TaxID=118510 RepID=A0A699KLP4_TANCI|nr:S-adenosyl-L-methionine-dependent methyltransferases superfamily protein [Tanacetum cinerariifolium]
MSSVMVDIVETDPVVISTSTQAMGFLSYSIMKQLGHLLHPKLTIFDQILWKGVQERLHLYESDAEQFITDKIDIYDMVFVDAYDGDDNIDMWMATEICVGVVGGVPESLSDLETDPVVISTSTQAMGFLSYSIMKQLGHLLHPKLTIFDQILWKGVQERLHLYESDAEQFITDKIDIYDMVFVDAYDGDDVFPHKL